MITNDKFRICIQVQNLLFVNEENWNVWNIKFLNFLEQRTAYEIIHILFSSQFPLIFAPVERWKMDDSVTTAISPYLPKTIDVMIHGDEFVREVYTCTGGRMISLNVMLQLLSCRFWLPPVDTPGLRTGLKTVPPFFWNKANSLCV